MTAILSPSPCCPLSECVGRHSTGAYKRRACTTEQTRPILERRAVGALVGAESASRSIPSRDHPASVAAKGRVCVCVCERVRESAEPRYASGASQLSKKKAQLRAFDAFGISIKCGEWRDQVAADAAAAARLYLT